MGYSRIKLAGPKMTYYVTFSTYYVTCKITDGRPTRQKLGNQPLPPPGAGVWRDTGRDPRVHVERERAGHLAVPGSPPVRRYGPPQPPLQPFPLCQTLLDRGIRVPTLVLVS